MTLEQLQFGGKVHSLAEDELSASLTEDRDSSIVNSLWDEYVLDGSPKDVKNWLRPRIKELFRYASNRPQWVEDRPAWPFLNGRPMVFISQVEPPTGKVRELICEDHVLYIFGIREEVEAGWKMVYKVVSQNRTLRGIVAVPKPLA